MALSVIGQEMGHEVSQKQEDRKATLVNSCYGLTSDLPTNSRDPVTKDSFRSVANLLLDACIPCSVPSLWPVQPHTQGACSDLTLNLIASSKELLLHPLVGAHPNGYKSHWQTNIKPLLNYGSLTLDDDKGIRKEGRDSLALDSRVLDEVESEDDILQEHPARNTLVVLQILCDGLVGEVKGLVVELSRVGRHAQELEIWIATASSRLRSLDESAERREACAYSH